MSLDDERVPLPEGATVEDLRGRFLIPGLFDSHVHWGGSGGVGAAPIEQTDDRLAHDFERHARRGRDLGGVAHRRPRDMRALSSEVAAGKQSAPRTFFSGPSVTARADIPRRCSAFLPGLAEQLTRQVETPDEARAAIAELDRERVDLVKLVLEPGFDGRPLPRLRDEVFRAAMAEAKSAPDANDGARRHRRGRAAGDRGRRQRHRAHRARA